MISKIFLPLILLASNALGQWNEWAWETPQIPYSRYPTNTVRMYVQTNQYGHITDQYPADGLPYEFSGWQEWIITNMMVRAQDQRALDCWYALLERYDKLGVFNEFNQMPYPISFYRTDIENLEALKGLILGLAGTINADADPYIYDDDDIYWGGEDAEYPMFVNPAMISSPTNFLGIIIETDRSAGRLTNDGPVLAWIEPSRHRYSEIAVSPWSAQISESNLLSWADLPVYWTNYTSLLNQELHPDARLSRLDPYTVEGLDVFGCLASGDCWYPPDGNPLPVNPNYPTTMPSFVWSYESAFRPTDAYIYARTSFFNTIYWYQEPSFQTNGYQIGAYNWDRIRNAIRQFKVVAVPRIRDEVSDEYKIVWTREPISGQYSVTYRDHDCRGYDYTWTETTTVSGLSFPSPYVSRRDVSEPSGFVGWNVQAIAADHVKASAYAYWMSKGEGRHCSRAIPGACAYLDNSAYTTPSNIWQHSYVYAYTNTSITTNIVRSPRFDDLPAGVVAWFVRPLYSAGVFLQKTTCGTAPGWENELVVITTNTLLNVTNYTYLTTAEQSPTQSSDETYSWESCIETQGICSVGTTVQNFYKTLQHSIVFHPYILLYAVKDVSDEFVYK